MAFRYKITSRADSKTCPPCAREGVGVADGRVVKKNLSLQIITAADSKTCSPC